MGVLNAWFLQINHDTKAILVLILAAIQSKICQSPCRRGATREAALTITSEMLNNNIRLQFKKSMYLVISTTLPELNIF